MGRIYSDLRARAGLGPENSRITPGRAGPGLNHDGPGPGPGLEIENRAWAGPGLD